MCERILALPSYPISRALDNTFVECGFVDIQTTRTFYVYADGTLQSDGVVFTQDGLTRDFSRFAGKIPEFSVRLIVDDEDNTKVVVLMDTVASTIHAARHAINNDIPVHIYVQSKRMANAFTPLVAPTPPRR